MDNHIGLKIKELCKQKGVSGAELARRLGIKPQAVQTLFNTKNPRTDTFEKALEAIGVSREEFWGGQQTAPVVEEDTVTIKKSEYTAMLEQLVKYQQKELEDQKAVIEKQAQQNQSISTPAESFISK